MSVMNSNEEPVECPLCMEPLEMDDVNFYPCTCGYQICRFCWHRIRTDENGLCPACRKPYPENPADFTPLSQQELQKIKAEKKQKDLQRKQKMTENRKHLANVRVVQKNLVFVVGLSPRLSDPEVLKKHEYFGKFGKIHKVVINHSTAYAGSQGPSASAFVTYIKAEDALRAIQAVNNVTIDGRTLKASLGTTKYCSHFMKNQTCPKPDCMYLHELGDEAASFTKEEMQQEKHQEYEKKLHDQLLQALQNQVITKSKEKKSSTPPLQINSQVPGQSPCGLQSSPPAASPSPKDNWPSLHLGQSGSSSELSSSTSSTSSSLSKHRIRSDAGQVSSHSSSQVSPTGKPHHTNDDDRGRYKEYLGLENGRIQLVTGQSPQSPPSNSPPLPDSQHSSRLSSHSHLFGQPDNDNSSFFTNSVFSSVRSTKPSQQPSQLQESRLNSEWSVIQPDFPQMPEQLPVVDSQTDWQKAFGFSAAEEVPPEEPSKADDDLGFDPFEVTAKALGDLIEKESQSANAQRHIPRLGSTMTNGVIDSFNPVQGVNVGNHRTKLPPPGFSNLGYEINSLGRQQQTNPDVMGSKMLSFMGASRAPPHQDHHQCVTSGVNVTDVMGSKMLPFMGASRMPHQNQTITSSSGLFSEIPHRKPGVDAFNSKDWQEGLRALLPNINISFGALPVNGANMNGYSVMHHQNQQLNYGHNSGISNSGMVNHHLPHHFQQKGMVSSGWSSTSHDLLNQDPAIVSSGHPADSTTGPDSPPHWMKSLEQLTETGPMYPPSHPQLMPSGMWPPPAATPPPGFSTSLRPAKPMEQH